MDPDYRTLSCVKCPAVFQVDWNIRGRKRQACHHCSKPKPENAQTARKKAAEAKSLRPAKPCENCGEDIRFKVADAKFCCQTCATSARKRTTCFIDGCAGGVQAKGMCCAHYNQARNHGSVLEVRTCPQCGAGFSDTRHRVFCSMTCRKQNRIDARPKCEVCGHQCRQHRMRWCSWGCRKRSPSKQADWRKAGFARRARLNGNQREYFDPLEILERDGWRCQICGVPTPKKLRGSQKPNAPVVDHVVSLKAGGAHTRGNTQCACRECNSNKGAGPPIGQIGLFTSLMA